MRLPDFIIGGAPRSGTTWLYQVLDRHPGIYMAKPMRPEPKFFLVDEIYARGLPYYSSLFADAKANQIAGEKTTNYLESAVAAERIHEHLPALKLVFVLRDPVERAFSNYLWSRMNGMEQHDFATALEREAEREREVPSELRYARPHSYYSRGLYADLLGPYFRLFPRSQLLCLRYEDIISRPRELVTKVQRFLKVDPRPADGDMVGVVNASHKDGLRIPIEAARWLAKAYEKPNRRLAQLLGPDFEVWTNERS